MAGSVVFGVDSVTYEEIRPDAVTMTQGRSVKETLQVQCRITYSSNMAL